MRLNGHQRLPQRRVRSSGDPQFQRRDEQRTREKRGEEIHHGVDPFAQRQRGERAGLRLEFLAPPVDQVRDGGKNERGLRGVVVQLSAAGYPGSLRHERGRGAGPTHFDQALDGRVE
jgi:hypothetical protein